MAKDPAFLFYSDNFQSGTQFFTDEQLGKYIRLLCAQHLHGHLDEKKMLHICKTYDKDIWEKFKQDDAGKFYNERLEIEVLKRRSYSDSRSTNRKSKINSKKKPKNISQSYDNHMGDGDGNGNINEISLKGVQGKTLSATVLEAVERNQFSHTGDRNTDFVNDQWEVFLLERQADSPHVQRQNKDRLGEYFINWMRTKFPSKQKKKNGFDVADYLKKHGDEKI